MLFLSNRDLLTSSAFHFVSDLPYLDSKPTSSPKRHLRPILILGHYLRRIFSSYTAKTIKSMCHKLESRKVRTLLSSTLMATNVRSKNGPACGDLSGRAMFCRIPDFC